MEFQLHYETTLINHITDMAECDETELRLVLVSQPPAVSCIASLWALQGQEMYRKQLRTAGSLNSSLHQDMNMLRISPQMQQMQQMQATQMQEIKSRHPMQTRSKTK
jgi:hypothetical protein